MHKKRGYVVLEKQECRVLIFCGTPTPGMCDILIVYFRVNGEKIEILQIKGAQQCATKFLL